MSGKKDNVKIAVIGVGGCGCNAVKMIEDETVKDERSIFKDSNVRIIAANTDAQVLEQLTTLERIQLGPKLTKGQGAGGMPDCGKDAALESQIDIATAIEGCDMVFVTAGMGGGTGTGAAPVIAGAAKKTGILTVGIVTKPFSFEGKQKMKTAENGIGEMSKNVDALLVVPNDTLLEIAGDDDDTVDMFKKPNEILIYAVRSISELIINPGEVNVDFADVRNTMRDMGIAVIGFGSATGEHAPLNAVKDALNNPLLKNFTIEGTRKMLVYISGKTKMREFAEASAYLNDLGDESAQFKFGLFVDEKKTDVSVLIVAEAHEKEAVAVPKEHERVVEIREEEKHTVETENREKTAEELVFEVQKPNFSSEEKVTPAASKNSSFDPQSVNVKDAKPFSFNDEVFLIPENNINQNDKTIPAVLRRASKSESEKEKNYFQISLEEYVKK